jgi:hemerythrin-like metal-binding protein
MQFVPTGVGRLDHAHAGIDHCLHDLGRAVGERDAVSARGWACLLVQKLGEHFSDEEQLMRSSRWPLAERHAESHRRILLQFSEFERELASHAVSPELSYLALIHLPEILRVHIITSDFGFAKFVTGRAFLPFSRGEAQPADARHGLAWVLPSSAPKTPPK